MRRDHATKKVSLGRRTLLAGAAGTIALTLVPYEAAAAPEDLAAALKTILGDKQLQNGRVKIEIPPLADNGNSVPITISVESPMTAADHVKAIHILSEKNPLANIVRFGLGPRSGVAKVQTNIRLALTQKVTVVAEMSDASFFGGTAETIVTAAACLEDT